MTLDLTKFQVFAVGGYVRDRLLGYDPKDHDYVVCGATPDDMISAGFDPIEASFPIFIHPQTRDEYALARKERKVAAGYHGFEVMFDPSVTIEEDLYRRDLTVNAMARRVIGWNDQGHAKLSNDVIDPFDGQQDLRDGVLRHVSEAFAEDPVRILRTTRFAARYVFDIHPDTVELMGKIASELNNVPQERIWAEFEKGLCENSPWLMFETLDECGAMETEALRAYRGADTLRMRFITPNTVIHTRVCLAALGFNDADYDTCRIPTEYARISKAFNKHFEDLVNYKSKSTEDRVRLFDAVRAFSDPMLLYKVLNVLKVYDEYFPTREIMSAVINDLADAVTVIAEDVAQRCKTGAEIKQKLFTARVNAIGS